MIRTGYSFRRAVGHLPDVVSRVREIGWDVIPVADDTSTFSFVQVTKLAKAAGLRPVYGVRLNVVPKLGLRRGPRDSWMFMAKQSLRPLHDLIYRATENENACLLYGEALSAEGVVKIAGEFCLLDNVEPAEDLFLGLSPATPKSLYAAAKKKGVQLCAVGCNLYPRKADKEFYRVSMPVEKRGREFFSTAQSQTYPQHIVDDYEWCRSVDWFVSQADQLAAIQNRDGVIDSCRAELKVANLLVPEKPKTLRQMCVEGAARTGTDLTDPAYAARLERELSVIAEKKFEDYFYILADIVGYAKKEMVVGPARGSSCGSLVCYLLDITSIDPIPYKLVFERFIDVTRSDLPDVDIDFSDERRYKVFEYAEKKFGKDHVARLGTVGSFQPRSALNQVASALRIPGWRIEKVTTSIIKRMMGDSRASQTLEDTLEMTDVGKELCAEYPEVKIVSRLEDHPTNAGQHAAGVVITELPVTEHVAVDARTGATMCDKKDAEALNLLKIDALGLTQLSVFERTLELIGKPSRSGWLETIPLDDEKAFDVLNRGHFSGVFQFTGNAVQGITRQIVIDKFDDLVAITALARPGPLGGGGTDMWVRRRNGRDEVTYPHEVFKPFLKDTLGIVIYQEQVLAIGREVGGLSWEEVTKLRQAMSRSLGKEFFDLHGGNKWKAAAVGKGIPQDVVERVWNDLCTFGMWAFNAAHSVAYATVSYWCCYLKAYYPVEFAAATLDSAADPAAQIAILRELKEEGVDYVPVDQERSTNRWSVAREGNRTYLIGPLRSIKGIGPKKQMEILDSRRNGTELKPSLLKMFRPPETSIDSLFPIADAVAKSRNKIATPKEYVTRLSDVKAGDDRWVVVYGLVTRIAPLDENEPARVAKRNGRRIDAPSTQALNLFVRDDTDEIYCKVRMEDYQEVGKPIVERGRAGQAVYAFKGFVPRGDFRMIYVKDFRYITDMARGDEERAEGGPPALASKL